MENSITTSGTKISPRPIRYCCHVSRTRPNAVLTGVKRTSATRRVEVSAARFRFLFLNGPILNSECSERTLNACTTWDSAKTMNASVCPFSMFASTPPQRFHGRQTADQCVLLYHPLYADGAYDGNDSGQSLGNGRYGKGNGGHKHMKRRQIVDHTYHEDDAAGGKRHDAQIFTQLCQLLLQGSLDFYLAVQKIGDLTHFGIHTGGGDYSQRRAVGDGTAGIHHVVPVTQRCVFLDLGGGILFGGNGFTGEGGFLGFQSGAMNEARVSRDEIACFQLDYIAGDQISGVDDRFLSVPDDPSVGADMFLRATSSFSALPS